jgi:hypothetical protein
VGKDRIDFCIVPDLFKFHCTLSQQAECCDFTVALGKINAEHDYGSSYPPGTLFAPLVAIDSSEIGFQTLAST